MAPIKSGQEAHEEVVHLVYTRLNVAKNDKSSNTKGVSACCRWSAVPVSAASFLGGAQCFFVVVADDAIPP